MKKLRTNLKALLLSLAWASPVLATDPPQYTGTFAVDDVSDDVAFVNNRSGGDGNPFLARSVTVTATGNTCFLDLGDTLTNSIALAGAAVATVADVPIVAGTPYVVNLGAGYNPPAGWAGLAGICSAGQTATWTITANRYDTPSVEITGAGDVVAAGNNTLSGTNEFSGPTNISGPDALTNVEIGSRTTDSNAGNGGTTVAVGHNVSNTSNSAGVTMVGNTVLANVTAATSAVGIGTSVTLGNGGGGCVRGVAIGNTLTCNLNDTLLIGSGLATSLAGIAVIANSTAGYNEFYFGKGYQVGAPTTVTFNGTGTRPGTDTNVAGGGLTFSSGIGTGNATGSSLTFQAPTPVGSGASAQTETTVLTLNTTAATLVPQLLASSGSDAAPGLSFSAASNRGFWQTTSGNHNGVHVSNSGIDSVSFPAVGSGASAGGGVVIRSDGRFAFAPNANDPIDSNPDIGISRNAAGQLNIDGGQPNTAGCVRLPSANGAAMLACQFSEVITLNTGGTTTNSSANLLPANSIIDAVVTRVTTTITTAVTFSVGDSTTAARFSASAGGMTAGSTRVGLDHMSGAVTTLAAGPTQAADATVRITTNANPGAGAIRVTVYFRSFTAPSS